MVGANGRQQKFHGGGSFNFWYFDMSKDFSAGVGLMKTYGLI